MMPSFSKSDTLSLPVRMCAQLVYCPRLFYLEHVQGIFVESSDVVKGRAQHQKQEHRRTKGSITDTGIEEEQEAKFLSRGRVLRSERWGVSGKTDLVEFEDGAVIPVEFKKGRKPKNPDQAWRGRGLSVEAWPGDVVQVGLYMALLREAGLKCEHGRIYYRESKASVQVDWSFSLARTLREVVFEAGIVSRLERPPEPLQESPKCARCSLVGVCLPLEHNFMKSRSEVDSENTGHQESLGSAMPRLVPGVDHKSTLHIVTPGSMVRKKGENLVVQKRDGESFTAHIKDLAHVAIYGPSQMTQQCMLQLLAMNINVTHHAGSGRVLGVSHSLTLKNVAIRRAQFRACDQPQICLEVSRALVNAKVRNQRTLLRRNRRSKRASMALPDELPDWALGPAEHSELNRSHQAKQDKIGEALKSLKATVSGIKKSDTLDQLRGYEGEGAAVYFRAFPLVLSDGWSSEFKGRTRRPPRDRVNAMLSFGYALLEKDAINSLVGIGLDPMVGFLHTMIAGRPSCALDVMEPFRPAWVDTAILRLIATNGISKEHFFVSDLGVSLSDVGRRLVIAAYERRADEQTTHHLFGYKLSYRRQLALDCRMLAKYVHGEVAEFSPFLSR